jgi:hypothetical protein
VDYAYLIKSGLVAAVIAGEPEGSRLAGGQQEGLQYSGGSAWCSVAQRSRR